MLNTLATTVKQDKVESKPFLCAGDEAQLQEVSPVVGLLEAQQGQGPDEQQQQQTGAEQYGSMGFFGSLCSAPPVNAPGLPCQS